MGNFTKPNEVLNPGHSLEYNQPGVIHPDLQRAPKQLQQFATGQIPVQVPWPTRTVTPTTSDQMMVPGVPKGR